MVEDLEDLDKHKHPEHMFAKETEQISASPNLKKVRLSIIVTGYIYN